MLIRFFEILTYYFSYPIIKFIFRAEVITSSNLKDLNLSEKLIIAANHTHFLDSTIGGWAYVKYFRSLGYPFSKILPLRYLASSEYFNFFKAPPFFPLSVFVALFVRLNGSIPVNRESKDDLENKLKIPIDVLNNNGKIFIFPEGKMSKDGNLQKAKRGIGYLHKKTGAKIIPMAIINAYQCTKFKNLIRFLIGKRRIKICFGEPLEKLESLEIEEISQKVIGEIDKLIKIDKNEKLNLGIIA
ncbi:MAG: 1-acyl-sn-glycerol-3-phosphate acyltransferase [Patescibacteria group bacterium]|nr:1-acyl-sn-glycerol-3-phosphate acyltransferase [Patescibacteria group bacterium]